MTFPDGVLRDAERLLTQLAATAVSIVRCDILTQESSVARCTISGSGSVDLPRSVIVRTHRREGGWRVEDRYLFNDYAAACFLRSIGSQSCPRVLVADMEAGVEITEDLGPGPSLDDFLAGTDPEAATAAVVAFARSLGALHGETAGRAADYYQVRATLGPIDPAVYQRSLNDKPIDQAWAQLIPSARAAVGIPAPNAASGELDGVLELLDSAAWLAFSNGDPCPYNCHVAGERVRFFDFELAGYRHVLLDAAHLRFPFPTCYRFGRFPETVRAAAEQAYRNALAPHMPLVLDESAYPQGMAAACAAWAIACAARLLASHHPSAVELHRIRAASHTFITAARAADVLIPLADWFENLSSALGRRSPTSMVVPPVFPAFR